MKKICILDYGLGNTKSLYNSIKYLGYEVFFYSEKKKKFDAIFIPGIGSFSKASELIVHNQEYFNFINNNKDNCLIFGICLGMQILFDKGHEFGVNPGLSLIKGEIKKLDNTKSKILPFVGYQKVFFNNKDEYFKKFEEEKFYFVHSYFADQINNNDILAMTNAQDKKYCCAVKSNNIIGTQFHPEKSGEIGLEFLKSTINNF